MGSWSRACLERESRFPGRLVKEKGKLTMWTSARATVGVVAKLMDVHATLGGRVVPLDIVGDCGGR